MITISIITAIILNIINALFSLYYIKRIIQYKWVDFIQKFYLMMIIRFILFISLMFCFFKYLKFDTFAFAITFILIYFIILIFEIIFIHKRHSKDLKKIKNN